MREPSTYKEKYAEQLSNHGKGVAVWHPAPNEQLDGTFKSIALGDVGYFFNGSFVKLFNVASARVARVLDNNQSEENRFTSKSVQARITTVDSRNEIAQLSANLTCAGVSGAALIIPSHTRPGIVSRDLKHRATYAEHCFRHWREWLSVAQDQATKHVSLKDLIFVSGIDYVHMWSLFSFQRPSQTRTVRLYVGPSTVSGSFDGDDPIMNFGPRKRPLNPSTCFPGYDQCVFIRRFKMHGRVEQLRWRTERLLRGPRVVTINEPEPIQIPLDTTNPNVDSQSTRDNNPGREVQISIDSPYMQRSQEGNDEDDASEGVHGEADEGTSHDKVSSRKARRRNRRRGGDEEPGIAHGGNHRRGGGAGGAPAKGPPGNGGATGLIHPGSAPQGSDWQGGSSGGARGGLGRSAMQVL
ncbi:hypothetical protein BD410DRAFT_627316 [Rickenella mellea]|uniref:Uncharacterized protein n=1 Tax=Rickenella mellea TaxID=50990 RepID=A0A4Y7QCS5_9AGAM|nr:hypothetical protein BD410DRAFT_627316 [Rickenella mellea]